MEDQDPNVFAIIGRAQKAARNAGLSRQEIDDFVDDATSGNYSDLVDAVGRWFRMA
jgi:hypothetical protein